MSINLYVFSILFPTKAKIFCVVLNSSFALYVTNLIRYSRINREIPAEKCACVCGFSTRRESFKNDFYSTSKQKRGENDDRIKAPVARAAICVYESNPRACGRRK